MTRTDTIAEIARLLATDRDAAPASEAEAVYEQMPATLCELDAVCNAYTFRELVRLAAHDVLATTRSR